jgi:hypothetical protein
MTIQFDHKGEKITGKIIACFDAVTDVMIIFPDRNLGELGWSIFFMKRDNQWVSTSFIREKYPKTYTSLMVQLETALSDSFDKELVVRQKSHAIY